MTRKGLLVYGILLGLLALLGSGFLYWVTAPWGIGITPDSIGYLSSARNFLQGQGLSMISSDGHLTPMVGWPPLFPILLSAIGLVGIDPFEGARILNTVFLGLNLFLVGAILRYITRASWVALLGSIFMAASLCVLQIHSMAWSEPPFIFFSFAGLFLLALYLKKNQKVSRLMASAVFMSLAFFCRYAGFAFIAAAVLALLFLDKKKFLNRLWNCIIFGTIACFPTGLWLLRNSLVVSPTRTAIGLAVVFTPFNFKYVRYALATVSSWFVSENASSLIKAAALVLAATIFGIAAVSLKREVKNHSNETLPSLLKLFILCYAVIIVFYISFLGSAMILDQRTLSPLFVSGLILFFYYFRWFWYSVQNNLGRFMMMAILGLLSFSYTWRAYEWAVTIRREGQEFSGRFWRESPLIQKLSTFPAETLIYTNGSDVLYFLTGRLAKCLPATLQRSPTIKNPDWRNQRLKHWKEMTEALKRHNGLVVYFDRIIWRLSYPSQKELQENLPLDLVEAFSDGAIYKIKKP